MGFQDQMFYAIKIQPLKCLGSQWEFHFIFEGKFLEWDSLKVNSMLINGIRKSGEKDPYQESLTIVPDREQGVP